MTHAIRFHQTGGPEVLNWEVIEVGKPGAGEVRLRQTAVGLNFIDIYHRSGLYPVQLPAILGLEAAGVVEELGVGVSTLKVGDRVAYATPPMGAYAESRLIAADRVVRLPDNISDQLAAAMMLQGMTAEYLLRRTYHVQAGDTILIHAAAGGVGSIMCQWANHLGATVIGTVSSDEKAEQAKANGCRYPIIYTREDFVARVMEITDGKRLPVVYDSVGRDTFLKSLSCLQPLGMMVSFGQSSGQAAALDLNLLAASSLFLTRPKLADYVTQDADLHDSSQALFEVVGSGAVKIAINQSHALKDAAQAHRDLEARRTTGSTVLTV